MWGLRFHRRGVGPLGPVVVVRAGERVDCDVVQVGGKAADSRG